ncbi:transcription-repair-coupling factor [Clostridia bacterium]|nr:transcription-repair-coupling factor [Clostridia bacterium]
MAHNYTNLLARQLPEYRQISAHFTDFTSKKENRLPIMAAGLSHVSKAHFLAALGFEIAENSGNVGKIGNIGKISPVLVIAETEAAGSRLAADTNTLFPCCDIFPAKDLALGSHEAASKEYEYRRLDILSRLLGGQLPVVIASPEAAAQFTVPPDVLRRNTIEIAPGTSLSIANLAAGLVKIGYTRMDTVEGVSQFAIRGGIIDIFPVNSLNPYRIEMWGDDVDTVSVFSAETQRRLDTVKRISVPPAEEIIVEDSAAFAEKLTALSGKIRSKSADQTGKIKKILLEDADRVRNNIPPKNPSKYIPLLYPEITLVDYTGSIIVSENVAAAESFRAAAAEHATDIEMLFEAGELCRGLDRFMLNRAEWKAKETEKCAAYFETFPRGSGLSLSEIVSSTAVPQSPWSGEIAVLTEEIRDYFKKGYAVTVYAGTNKAARILARDLEEENIAAEFSENPHKLFAKRCYVLPGTLSGGIDYEEAKCVILTHQGVRTGAANSANIANRPAKPKKSGQQIKSLAEINVGDYVVHTNYGIGIFQGVEKLTDNKISKDYIKIKYDGTDALFVPVTQLDLISRYIGNTESGKLKLSKLHTDGWQKAKTKAKAAADELAAELIAIYEKRMKSRGFPFLPDSKDQTDFENHFSFLETEDQLRCISEIKRDMESSQPMERLLCGDVGFGKTEVALRAAFKCIISGKQCALLCPTTVLAWQHFQTATKRMENFPVTIELLSRFRTAKEVKAVIRKLETGEVDFLIGTHRLVGEDVKFRDLGLVIIDEEQRFGVNQKEKFKKNFAGVDVLTLSATPIPRTLNMAMSGLRDMSVIESPPGDRQPVTTYVIESDGGVLAGAINKEMRRGGQVYYIHNRIETIYDRAAALHKACPDAVFGIAHGRMGEDELMEVWRKLIDREIDVLVCTTLIETGVDVPNVNTLIIDDADHMGLAQLHQLRGRVGRRNTRAFAYFCFKRGKVLSEIASKRLSAIREFTQFGSGFKIAMRDLEIRGAGSVLGERQSGHLSAVGYDMYLKMLSDSVNAKNGVAADSDTADENECLVDIKTDAYIPDGYIKNQSERIRCYKRIAEILTEDDVYDVTDELIDRYGELPKAVCSLIEIAKLRRLARALGITEIIQSGDVIRFGIGKDTRPDLQKIIAIDAAVPELSGRISLNMTGKSGIMLSTAACTGKKSPSLSAMPAMPALAACSLFLNKYTAN